MNNQEGRDNPLWDLLRSQHTAADCQHCREHLHEYVDAQINGRDIRTIFPRVTRHLDSCVECASAYALIYEAIFAEQAGTLPIPAAIPQPNLSFLPNTESLVSRLQRALNQTAAHITLQLDAGLRALLAPPPDTVLVRSGESGRYHPVIITLTTHHLPDTPLPLTLTAYADSQHPGYCLVEVTVQPPGQSWPDLGGRHVTLTTTDGSHTTATDDWGIAAFPGIRQTELDTLKVEVTLR